MFKNGVSKAVQVTYQIQLGYRLNNNIRIFGAASSYISSSAVSNSVYLQAGFVVVNSPAAAFGYSGFATYVCFLEILGIFFNWHYIGSNATVFFGWKILVFQALSTEYA
jgi:hypothetical protein